MTQTQATNSGTLGTLISDVRDILFGNCVFNFEFGKLILKRHFSEFYVKFKFGEIGPLNSLFKQRGPWGFASV